MYKTDNELDIKLTDGHLRILKDLIDYCKQPCDILNFTSSVDNNLFSQVKNAIIITQAKVNKILIKHFKPPNKYYIGRICDYEYVSSVSKRNGDKVFKLTICRDVNFIKFLKYYFTQSNIDDCDCKNKNPGSGDVCLNVPQYLYLTVHK